MNKSASEETLQDLYETMRKDIEELFSALCNSVNSIKYLQQYPLLQEDSDDVCFLQMLCELKAFVCTVKLDICTFLRADLRAKHPCEKRINLKYINVVIQEGYKYLCGFGKDRKNSKWLKFKEIAGKIDNTALNADIAVLDKTLLNFEEKNIPLSEKDNRDLALHYDKNPLRVYDFLLNISEETEAKKVINFLPLLDCLYIITSKYIRQYGTFLPKHTNDPLISVFESINVLDDRDNRFFNNMGEVIDSYSKRLETLVNQCKLPEKFQITPELIAQDCKPIIESIYPGLHIHFIYLDLACAFRAYFSSESYIEKQLNLRRVAVVVYDGFARIYGYNAKQQKQSFWENICSNLESCKDSEIVELLQRTRDRIKELSEDSSINNSLLREHYIHYRKDNRDNVVHLYDESLKAFPVFEMSKALKLFRILPDVIKLNSVSMDTINRKMEDKRYASYTEMINKLYNLLDLIKDPIAKQNMKSSIDKIEELFRKFK